MEGLSAPKPLRNNLAFTARVRDLANTVAANVLPASPNDVKTFFTSRTLRPELRPGPIPVPHY